MDVKEKERAYLLLYRYPLFKAIAAGERDMDVLLLGGGEDLSGMLDLILAAGQMREHDLYVTAAVPDADGVRKAYLKERPALTDFAEVDGTYRGGSEAPYARLAFRKLPETDAALSELLLSPIHEQYHYIYIDNGARGRDLAGRCAALVREMKLCALIACAVDGDILVCEDASAEAVPRENCPAQPETAAFHSLLGDADALTALRDIAFRTHLLWNGSRNSDREKAWLDFQKPYNYESSLAFAASVPYLLASAGIGEVAPEAARRYAALMRKAPGADGAGGNRESAAAGGSGPSATAGGNDASDAAGASSGSVSPVKGGTAVQPSPLAAQMAQCEHRRWIMNMVCRGWRGPAGRVFSADLRKMAARGSVRDDEGKFHPCIVRSRDDLPLFSETWQGNRRALWQRTSAEDLTLDPLDAFSVELHRYMESQRKNLAKKRAEERPEVKEIMASLAEAPEWVRRVLDRYLYCLDMTGGGDASHAAQFSRFEEDLLRVCDRFRDPSENETIRGAVASLRKLYFPAIEAALYRDYKAIDVDLVTRLPYLLTYDTRSRLAMAFDASESAGGVNDVIFKNVASAMILKPTAMLWMIEITKSSRIGLFVRMLDSCLKYLRRLHLTRNVTVAVGVADTVPEEEKKRLVRMLREIGGGAAEAGGCEEAESAADAGSASAGITADTGSASAGIAADAGNASAGIAADAGGAPCRRRIRFRYAVRNTASAEEGLSFFEEMMVRCGSTLADGSTVPFLSPSDNAAYTARLQEKYPYFELTSENKRFTHVRGCDWIRYIPDRSSLRVEDLFLLMDAENGALHYPPFAQKYKILWGIYTGEGRGQTNFTRAVGTWNFLCDALSHELGDTIRVADLNLREAEETNRILTALADQGFLTVEADDRGRIRQFTYASDGVKSLLTKAGEILEWYCYFEAFKTGYFDDLATGVEFAWREGDIKNELDLVLTRGFRCMFVECKAQKSLSQDYFHKLASLSDLFGIHVTRVIIANNYSSSETALEENERQALRGEQMDIITIRTREELTHIGERLVELMERQ